MFEAIQRRNQRVLSECQWQRDNSLPPEYDEEREFDEEADPGYDGVLGEG